jgi:hypothetical protein
MPESPVAVTATGLSAFLREGFAAAADAQAGASWLPWP